MPAELALLTTRQLLCLVTWWETASIKATAARLGLSEWTVATHLRDAKRRTGCPTMAHLVMWADDHEPGWRDDA